ncbi:MAG: very short patch repair endonuclease [Candidatus Cryosericum sp.]
MAVRNKDTRLEMAFRRYIWSHGIRGYRVRSELFGRPDLVFPGPRVAVFVDGCLWHGCPVCHEVPRTHGKFWSNKIRGNIERDLQVNQRLAQEGWSVLRFWGHEVKSDPESCRARLVQRLADSTEHRGG